MPKILLLQTRNIGDAIIGTAFLDSISRSMPDVQIDVLARPQSRRIFETNPAVTETVTGHFPMGYVRGYGSRDAISLFKLLFMLRKRGYTDVVDLTGDIREQFIARFVSRGNSWSPRWTIEHPYLKLIMRPWFGLVSKYVDIPAATWSIYEATALMGEALGGRAGGMPALYDSQKRKISWTPVGTNIGIHPLASQPWRIWDTEKWTALMQNLISAGLGVTIYGAPSDREQLIQTFGRLVGDKLKIQTGDIDSFIGSISTAKLLVCQDSFAAHCASALGVPIIFLNGANDYRVWAPPGATVFAAGPEMECYPCYNRPTCIGKTYQFDCIRSIPVEPVLAATLRTLIEIDDAPTQMPRSTNWVPVNNLEPPTS